MASEKRRLKVSEDIAEQEKAEEVAVAEIAAASKFTEMRLQRLMSMSESRGRERNRGYAGLGL